MDPLTFKGPLVVEKLLLVVKIPVAKSWLLTAVPETFKPPAPMLLIVLFTKNMPTGVKPVPEDVPLITILPLLEEMFAA